MAHRAPPHLGGHPRGRFQPWQLCARSRGTWWVLGGCLRQPRSREGAASASGRSAAPTGAPAGGKPAGIENVHAQPVAAPDPLERLHSLASDIASALEFMTSKFGPPALPHLTVSPIPGSFGQGFPGLIYLPTVSYLRQLPNARSASTESAELFFEALVEAHETAHQWWGNRVTAATYRDNWLMEALANYSALLYMEKTKGPRSVEVMMDAYRARLLEKNESGQTVESAGPIVLGARLSSSLQPAGWNSITYGKGSWIVHMLRRRMGDTRFFAMLAATLQRYDHADLSTEEFRLLASSFLPKSDDPKLEAFFDQWVYGTGIPALKLTYNVRGTAPALRLTGTITQTDADDSVSVSVPVEIQVARGNTVIDWVRTASEPATFTVALKRRRSKSRWTPTTRCCGAVRDELTSFGDLENSPSIPSLDPRTACAP